MKVATLQDVLIDELQDLFDAEKQLVRALPKMARSASHPELVQLFREHVEVTKTQVQRLEQCFGLLDQRARSKPCLGMKGLVEEQQEVAAETRESALLDAGLLGAARKVEHYEMAGYATVIALAQQLGRRDCARLLTETLREEMETERRLAAVAKRLMKEAGRMETAQTGRANTRSRGATTRGASENRVLGQSRSGRRSATGRSATGRSAGGRSQSARRQGGGAARPLIDHDEIRSWAEERGAKPASVRGTGRKKGDAGMIRLDFPGWSGEESLMPISWDEWFRQFDSNNLALMVQDKTARGEKSNFNKIVSREAVQTRRRGAPKVKRAGG